MKYIVIASTAIAATTTGAYAAGLDRASRSTDFIFEDGNKVEFSAGFANPTVSGSDLTGSRTGNFQDTFSIFGAAVRYELNENLAFGLILAEPYGVDLEYGPSSPILGGTAATVDSTAFTAFGRYKFNENFSVHGGVTYQNLSANVTLAGAGFLGPGGTPGLNGFNAAFSNDSALGYMLGAAYEIPEIALRVALTYHSEIDHDLDTTETSALFGTLNSVTEVTTPETIELAFQTGVAENTLVFGSVRFSHYSVTDVSPTGFDLATPASANTSITDLENAFDVELGVGRRFNDQWAGSITAGWSESGEDNIISPLSGVNGSVFLALGASYQVSDRVQVSGGVRYTEFRDAIPNIGGVPIGSYEGNSAISAGMRVQIGF